MRLRLLLAAFSVGAACTAAAACGLDENGLMGDASGDATTSDVSEDVVPTDAPIDVPQACTTLDASACVDAAIPDGWTYAAVAFTQQPCPSADYVQSDYIYGPSPDAGCTCACSASGTLDCSGTVRAGTQAGCTGAKSTTFDAGNDAACVTTSWNDQHISIGPLPLASAAGATCDAGAPPPGWTASAATACTPSCKADFCGVGSGFQRCIVSTTSKTCPAPFTHAQPALGTPSRVTTSCSGCTCAVDTPPCGATVTPYSGTDCTGFITDAAIPTDGACPPSVGANIDSFSYVPSVPPATCSVTAGATPSAAFGQSVTVCCLPP